MLHLLIRKRTNASLGDLGANFVSSLRVFRGACVNLCAVTTNTPPHTTDAMVGKEDIDFVLSDNVKTEMSKEAVDISVQRMLKRVGNFVSSFVPWLQRNHQALLSFL